MTAVIGVTARPAGRRRGLVAPWLFGMALAACGGGGGGGSTPVTPPGEPETPLVWTPPGGNATVAVSGTSPFMQFAPGVDASEMAGVSQGRELFLADWEPAPGTHALLDGLGPLFNATACTSCHASTGRVAPLLDDGSTTPAVLFRIGNAAGDAHPVYGGQLQTEATQGLAEGTVRWSTALNGAIDYVLELAGVEPMGLYRLSARISPQLVGMGLLDRVPESQILEYADEGDANGDGVSGRAHWVAEEGATRLGRFGWKAIHASLRAQNAGALHQDMGLTSPVQPVENCTVAQAVCGTAPSGGQPEVAESSLKAIVDFMTVLAVPDRRIADTPAFDRGARLFASTGCAACHRPTLTTGSSARFPTLSGQLIYPYTDLLLHDMGEPLSDGVREKDAAAAEWRTPPLWGLGLVEQRAGARFLHDGRAASIPEAIGWHGGEAHAARNRYQSLTGAERADLLLFLRGI